MRLLAIDPGIKATGFALLNSGRLERVWKVSLSHGGTVRKAHVLLDELSSVQPDAIAIEITDWHQSLRGWNWKVAYARERRTQRGLGFCLGVVAAYASQRGIEVVEVPVSEWQRAYSRSKEHAAWLVSQEFDIAGVVGGDISLHETDAICIGACALRTLSAKIQTSGSVRRKKRHAKNGEVV